MSYTGVPVAEFARHGLVVPDTLKGDNASLAWHSRLDMTAVLRLFDGPLTFFEMCQGVRIDSSAGYFNATPTQARFLDAANKHRWINVKKGRQAMITTASGLGILLRDCQYLVGLQGVLIADTRETAEMVFERLVYAYEHLDPSVRMPLARGRAPTVRRMKFAHGGSITVLTMGSRAPAVGRSIDRLHITEFGKAVWQKKAATTMFPTVAKRPSVRVILEGTPGDAGSPDHILWKQALQGRGRFFPLFLPWYDEAANAEDVRGDMLAALDQALRDHRGDLLGWGRRMNAPDRASATQRLTRTALGDLPDGLRRAVFAGVLTEEEQDYFSDIPAATLRHVSYRRTALDTEFLSDTRQFSGQFPKDPLDGWVGQQNPIIPADAVRSMMANAKPDGAFSRLPSGCLCVEPPVAGVQYVITGDPSHFGQSGDPSALACWRMRDDGGLALSAFWQGREDPGRFAARSAALQREYGAGTKPDEWPTLAMESNAMGAMQALLDLGAPNLYWGDRRRPGWFATAVRVQRAEAKGIRLLRDSLVEIPALSVLVQLADYDGSQRARRGRTPDGETHHFDIARCFFIAADIRDSLWIPKSTPTQPTVAVRVPKDEGAGDVSWKDLQEDASRRSAAKQPVGPSPWAVPPGVYRAGP